MILQGFFIWAALTKGYKYFFDLKIFCKNAGPNSNESKTLILKDHYKPRVSLHILVRIKDKVHSGISVFTIKKRITVRKIKARQKKLFVR